MYYYIVCKKKIKGHHFTKGKRYPLFRFKNRFIFFNDKYQVKYGLPANYTITQLKKRKSEYWKIIKAK